MILLMARRLRVEYEDAIYHVMNRGDRREPIFRDSYDRQTFLGTLGEACQKTEWQVHAYCLMGNHFHLVLETPQANLCTGMKWLLGTYTGRFNRRHQLVGHLFGGRYKALVVDGSEDRYFLGVCDYVHLNPVRARLVKPPEALRTYRWSSFPEYLKPARQRVPWLRVDRLLGELGIPKDSAAGRRKFEQLVEKRRSEDHREEFARIRGGWCFGDQEFRKVLLEQMSERMGAEHFGSERRESQDDKAERIVREELRRLRWKEKDLQQRAKGDAGKVAIAMRLRRESIATFSWIATRLAMGSRTYTQNLVYAGIQPKRRGQSS